MFGRVTITAEGLAVLPAPPPPARGRLAGGHQLDARRDRTARYASRLDATAAAAAVPSATSQQTAFRQGLGAVQMPEGSRSQASRA